jgi:hypothetical protein
MRDDIVHSQRCREVENIGGGGEEVDDFFENFCSISTKKTISEDWECLAPSPPPLHTISRHPYPQLISRPLINQNMIIYNVPLKIFALIINVDSFFSNGDVYITE